MTSKTAVAYFRTSSAANVGVDKDSLERQQLAVRSCAQSLGIQVVAEFYDAAVSGADPVDQRPGFREMMALLLSNGTRTVLVENSSRFARDLIVQETGYQMLKAQGITLIAADSPDSFLSDTPSAVMIRQMLGVVAQFEKAMLVDKLKGARDRASAKIGQRVEGAKWMGRIPLEHIKAAKELRHAGLALRSISAELAKRCMLSRAGTPYSARAVLSMTNK